MQRLNHLRDLAVDSDFEKPIVQIARIHIGPVRFEHQDKPRRIKDTLDGSPVFLRVQVPPQTKDFRRLFSCRPSWVDRHRKCLHT